jgi:DNA-binding CsgD family transcriptional regulator
MTAFGVDSALWTELDETAGSQPSRVIAYPEPLLDHAAVIALEQHAPGFPLTRHTRPGGDGRPVRRSDLQSTRDYRNSGMYADVAQKIGVDQVLATALATGVGVHVCIALNRAGPDFTSGAVDLLTRLRPLLARRMARLYANRSDRLAAGGGRTWPGQADLTPRQQQVLRLMAGGLTDAVIGRRLGCSPRTVDKHLEHIYRKLGVSCRTAAIAAAYKLPGADVDISCLRLILARCEQDKDAMPGHQAVPPQRVPPASRSATGPAQAEASPGHHQLNPAQPARRDCNFNRPEGHTVGSADADIRLERTDG